LTLRRLKWSASHSGRFKPYILFSTDVCGVRNYLKFPVLLIYKYKLICFNINYRNQTYSDSSLINVSSHQILCSLTSSFLLFSSPFPSFYLHSPCILQALAFTLTTVNSLLVVFLSPCTQIAGYNLQ